MDQTKVEQIGVDQASQVCFPLQAPQRLKLMVAQCSQVAHLLEGHEVPLVLWVAFLVHQWVRLRLLVAQACWAQVLLLRLAWVAHLGLQEVAPHVDLLHHLVLCVVFLLEDHLEVQEVQVHGMETEVPQDLDPEDPKALLVPCLMVHRDDGLDLQDDILIFFPLDFTVKLTIQFRICVIILPVLCDQLYEICS